jgi:hypothetical protein
MRHCPFELAAVVTHQPESLNPVDDDARILTVARELKDAIRGNLRRVQFQPDDVR